MNLDLQQFEIFKAHRNIRHFVSSRDGGVSSAPFNFLNLGMHVDDRKEDVLENRKRLSSELGINQENFVYLNQVQSNNVLVATLGNKGAGAFNYDDCIKETDAAITRTPGIVLLTLIADCVNMLLFDPKKEMIGVVHAGWEGTVNKAAQATIKKAVEEFGCDPGDIVAALGPSIGSCCYEIGDDVISKVQQYLAKDANVVLIQREGRMFFDAKKANKRQLVREGLKDENIEISDICTACSTDRFYSFRKEGKTGRFGAGIMLKQ